MIRPGTHTAFSLAGSMVLMLVCFTCTPVHGQPDLDIGFKHIRFNPLDTPSSNLTSTILQDERGYLWVGSMRGLHRYDGSILKTYVSTSDTSSLSSNSIGALHIDHNNRLWIGTRGRGIDLYDPVRDRFIRDADPLSNDLIVWSIYQPDSATLYVGARKYLVICDLEQNSCDYIELPSLGSRPNAVRDVLPNQADNTKLWLATLYGLWSFDLETKQLQNYPMPSNYNRPDGVGAYLLMDLWQQGDSVLWSNSWGGGILKYHIDKQQWSRFKVDPPHTDPTRWQNVILDLKPKSQNELWVATSHGFGIFKLKEGEYAFFEEGREPLLAPSFNHDAIGVTSDHRIVAGMYGGFNISDPMDDQPSGRPAYPPEIQTVLVDGYPYTTDTSASFLTYIEIDEDEKDVSFLIAAPGYFAGDQLTYSYMLEGYDRRWQTANGNRIRYTNLGRGRYSLRMRIRKNNEDWTYGANTLTIKKSGHIWESPWFFAGLAVLISVIVGLIYWINIRAIKKTVRIKSEYDKKIAGIEMAALRAQMNPHFMFNSLNSIKAYILKEKTDEASQYLTKFSRLMRAVLRNSKDPLVSLDDELSALELYVELEALRFEDEFSYSIEIEDSINTAETVIPPLLIQPYVENAIRHGLLAKESGTRLLSISVEKSGNADILVVVQDNGIGRKAASGKNTLRPGNKRSLGMEITGDRIALIEQTLGIRADVKVVDLYDSDKPQGTRVELRIPLLTSKETLS